MNAISPEYLRKSVNFEQATSLVSEAAQAATKNLEAAKDSFVTGWQGVEQARAQVVATGLKALEQQVAAASALAKVKSPQEALELQQQFAREALELYRANASALTTALTSAFTAALKPLNARYAELSQTVAKS